jgi:hypothetical protein
METVEKLCNVICPLSEASGKNDLVKPITLSVKHVETQPRPTNVRI